MTHVHQGLLRLTGHSKSHVQHIFPEMNIPEKRVPYTASTLHFTSSPLKRRDSVSLTINENKKNEKNEKNKDGVVLLIIEFFVLLLCSVKNMFISRCLDQLMIY